MIEFFKFQIVLSSLKATKQLRCEEVSRLGNSTASSTNSTKSRWIEDKFINLIIAKVEFFIFNSCLKTLTQQCSVRCGFWHLASRTSGIWRLHLQSFVMLMWLDLWICQQRNIQRHNNELLTSSYSICCCEKCFKIKMVYWLQR